MTLTDDQIAVLLLGLTCLPHELEPSRQKLVGPLMGLLSQGGECCCDAPQTDNEGQFIVDVPDSNGDWHEIATFNSWAAAIQFCQERFSADARGRVCLITEAQPLESGQNTMTAEDQQE